MIVLENISLLLNEALTPYQVSVGPLDDLGRCRVAVKDEAGHLMFERLINRHQFTEHRALVDVVDGFHRDLLVAQGRLQPCMLAAMQPAVAPAAAYALGA